MLAYYECLVRRSMGLSLKRNLVRDYANLIDVALKALFMFFVRINLFILTTFAWSLKVRQENNLIRSDSVCDEV